MNLIYDDQQGKMYADIRDFNAVCAGDLSDRTTLKLEAETKSLDLQDEWNPFPGQCQYLRNNGCGCRPCQ